MSHLYLPWGSGERYTNRLQVRNQFASTLELHKQSSYEYQEQGQRQRSPSLPPIHNIEERNTKDDRRNVLNRNIPSAKRFAFYDEDCEGDTSGYGSETVNHMNRSGQHRTLQGADRSPVVAWQQEGKDDRNRLSSDAKSAASEGAWSSRSPRSSEEGRLRWGDRGVATGRLWEPTAPNARLPQMANQKKGTPSWVERGLNMIENAAEVLVIDQRSSSNSTGIDCDRSSCNGSDEGRTFLRGQNVPIEPEIKAQRENKRLKALELQSAILSQLEDREKRRQEERERQLKEERLEELRIQRQQEEDRQRLEDERRKLEEKQLMEQKKLETLKKALEDAERKAKQDKEKRFTYHKRNSNTNLSQDAKPKMEEAITQPVAEATPRVEVASPTKTSRTYDIHSAKSLKRECNSQQTTEFNSPRSVGNGHLNLFIHSVPPLALTDGQFNIVPIGINSNNEIVNTQPNNIQLAVLVPQNVANNLYSVSLNSLNNTNELTDIGKLLTPNRYRTLRMKDASTQTDSIFKATTDKIIETDEPERYIDKDYPNIDENAPQDSHHNTLKKDRRFRSEERYKKDLENRPKWGVNRPAAQYKKQSEKDPFYSQKRKMRQKYRPQARQYLSHSSEDSRSPSPPTRSEKTIESGTKHRNSLSQSYWRSKRSSQDLTKTNNVSENNLQPDLNPLGSLTINEITEHKKSPKTSPLKRMTLSQKFINDKYGNRKLWIDDVNEKNSKANLYDVENRKKIIDQINTAKRELYEKHEDQENLVKHKF
ncbi:PH domain-containing protein DDB_G0275795 isoform X2 [Trichoplusia ni]|nr:PH domain-containing protein DDB_G0275795 isoform X2 [Trichoplusia ni]XP_026731941.1 PH domain-containing protein DDB_G0275795 isoform X2 [Trichoplusia ni]